MLFGVHAEMRLLRHCGLQLRASLGVIATPFAYIILVIVIMEILNGPVSALSDTAVLSSTKSKGDYGNCRFWASLAFNISGILSSAAMSIYGDAAVFMGYALGSAVAFTAAWHLSFDNVHTSPAPVTPPQPDLVGSCDKSTGFCPTEACAHSPVHDEERNSLDMSRADSSRSHTHLLLNASSDSPAEGHHSATTFRHLNHMHGAAQSVPSDQDIQVWNPNQLMAAVVHSGSSHRQFFSPPSPLTKHVGHRQQRGLQTLGTRGTVATASASSPVEGACIDSPPMTLIAGASSASLCLFRSESDQGDTCDLDEPLLPSALPPEVAHPPGSVQGTPGETCGGARQPSMHESFGQKLATACHPLPSTSIIAMILCSFLPGIMPIT